MEQPKQTHKVGRPRVIGTTEEMEVAIDSYFEKCSTDNQRPTITGLAIHLGYASKQSIYDNINVSEFSYPLKRATLFIENELEKRLDGNNVTGVIFGLKNMGWRDKTETEHTGSNGGPIESKHIVEFRNYANNPAVQS